MSRLYAFGALMLVAALAAGVAFTILTGRTEVASTCRQGAVAGGLDRIGGPFELVSETGRTVTDTEVITGPVLLYFGYTFCPDVCPLDTVRNAETVDILAARGHRVTPVFISVDHGRDTPQTMAAFTDNVHPDMIGLTGSQAQVAAAAAAYRVYFQVRDDGDDPFYLVDHMTFTYLVLPGAGVVDFYRRDLSPADMADRVACHLDAAA